MYHKNANKKQENVPTSGSNYARRMGIHRTSAGQQVPVVRAMSAQMLGLILGNTDKSLLFTIYS